MLAAERSVFGLSDSGITSTTSRIGAIVTALVQPTISGETLETHPHILLKLKPTLFW